MESEGDPRVLAAMNLVLSLVFSYVVVWGLDFIGAGELTWENVLLAAAALFVLTWVIVLR